MPLVSVVISTYNRSGLLLESLASALAQRDVDLEVVVVDNGSQDDTAARLAAVNDPRLRVIRNPRTLGPTRGRNTGLAAARGAWVGFLDDDDLWAPDKLAAQLAAARAAGRDWAYTGCVFIDRRRTLLGGTPPSSVDDLMVSLPVRYTLAGGISNILWRAGTLDGDGLLDERLTLTADWDLSLRLARSGPPAVVSRPLVAYRQHGANLSRRAAVYQEEFAIIGDKFADLRGGRRLDLALQQRFIGSECLRIGARRAAAAAYYRGFRGGDRGCLLRAAAIALPRRAHPWVRRRFLSDGAWLDEAQRWLDVAATGSCA